MPQLTYLNLILTAHMDFKHVKGDWPKLPKLLHLSISALVDHDSPAEGFWGTTMSNLRISGLRNLLSRMPVLYSLKLSHIDRGWGSIITALQRRALPLCTLEIEDSYIKTKALVKLFNQRGLGSDYPIDNFAIRRYPALPLYVKPYLEGLCQNLEWESVCEADESWKEFCEGYV